MFWPLDAFKPICLCGRYGSMLEVVVMALLLSVLFLWAIMVFGTVPAVLALGI